MIPESELLKNTLISWLESLDHEYMFLIVFVTWGIYRSRNMKWLVDRLGGRYPAIWKMGLYLALMEILRHAPIPGWYGEMINSLVIVLESFLIMMVAAEHIVAKINEYLKVLKHLKK